jgi:hypothetical protein
MRRHRRLTRHFPAARAAFSGLAARQTVCALKDEILASELNRQAAQSPSIT